MADIVIPHPLTDEHLGQINAALDGIKAAKMQVNLAKRAGIDVAAQETAVLDTERRLNQIKSVYFPNR